MKFYNIVCTFFGIGKIKFAPGTFGSMAAFPVWFFFDYLLRLSGVSDYFFYVFWLVFIISLFYLGVYCSNIHASVSGKKDASEIVVDEVVGQLIAIFISYYFVIEVIETLLQMFFYLVSVFLLFRAFDIFKPSLIGYADRNFKGGNGVMLDDVFAGVVSGVILILAIAIKVL